jgi:hypothetical protein
MATDQPWIATTCGADVRTCARFSIATPAAMARAGGRGIGRSATSSRRSIVAEQAYTTINTYRAWKFIRPVNIMDSSTDVMMYTDMGSSLTSVDF